MEDALRLGQSAKRVFAQVPPLDVVRQEVLRLPGQQDLAAVAREADPSGSVDLDAEVVLVGDDGLTGVQTHPYPHLGAGWPGVFSHSPLGSDGGLDRAIRVLEGDEELVATTVDLPAARLRHRSAQNRPVVDEHVAELLAEAVRKVGRALEVGEEERDRARR